MTGQLDGSVYFYPANYIDTIGMHGRSGQLQSANDVARFEHSHNHRPNSHTLAMAIHRTQSWRAPIWLYFATWAAQTQTQLINKDRNTN